MDDLLILTQTRWQLKRAVASMNRWFEQAGLQQHPDKTFIGRLEKGFDWLGYHFDAGGFIRVAAKIQVKFQMNLHRLYEQARRKKLSNNETVRRVVEYVRHWLIWTSAGISLAPQDQCTLLYVNPWDVNTPAGMD